MEKTRSEDTLIFNALTPSITDMTKVYETIEEFAKTKQTEDPSDRFNIILFEQNGPNYLQDFTLSIDNVMIALKSMEPMLVRANMAGGIFVAVTFIIDVFKKIPNKTFRLIILTDEGSLRIPPQFIPVLEDLLNKVKDMPFFMDIVRLDVDDPREDLKLMRLARRCRGDIHEINDIRSLSPILEVLAIKREVPTYSSFDDDTLEIPEEDQPFYENLAEEPIEVSKGTCSICFSQDSSGLVKCPSCGTIAHKKCWSQWAKNSTIGIFNVFRCHNCYNLLKLNPEYVTAVLTGQTPAETIDVAEQDYLQFLQSLETEEGPQIIQVADPMAVSEEEYEEIEIQFDDEEDILEEWGEYEPLDDDEVRIIWCPNCNQLTSNEYKKCPNCDYDISNI